MDIVQIPILGHAWIKTQKVTFKWMSTTKIFFKVI